MHFRRVFIRLIHIERLVKIKNNKQRFKCKYNSDSQSGSQAISRNGAWKAE